MKEIKFRAWDGKHKKIIYLSNSGYRMETLFFTICSYDDTGSCGDGYHIPDKIIMQYIGKKDKNGKEIYEKDFIRCESNSGEINICLVEYCENECRFALTKYSGNGIHRGNKFRYFPFGFSDTCSAVFDSDKMEVIGNLYENPEFKSPSDWEK
jgi:uncharacterized phage protein (TIGR01671 family)